MTHKALSELRGLCQRALEVELFTIPPYLTALYSLKPGANRESARILQGVVMEEMLHVVLMANVMNAIGGSPCLSPDLEDDDRSASGLDVRRYPSVMPHISLEIEVALRPFSPEAIAVFQKIEEPEEWVRSVGPPFNSIGAFYEYLLDKLVSACVELGEENVFCGQRERQVLRDEYYYGAGGHVTPVHSLIDAKDVISQVAEQGEGRRKITNVTGDQERFGQPKEVAHYFRFTQILEGRFYDRDDDLTASPSGPVLDVDWKAVYPIEFNGQHKHPGGQCAPEGLGAMMRWFDSAYRRLLRDLHKGLNGQKKALGPAVGTMHELRERTVALMKVPTGSGSATQGPPFWFIQSRA